MLIQKLSLRTILQYDRTRVDATRTRQAPADNLNGDLRTRSREMVDGWQEDSGRDACDFARFCSALDLTDRALGSRSVRSSTKSPGTRCWSCWKIRQSTTTSLTTSHPISPESQRNPGGIIEFSMQFAPRSDLESGSPSLT